MENNIDVGKALAAARTGLAGGLVAAAEHLLGESRKVVPIEDATLERSGRAEVDATELRAAVSYGTPYAVYQHERLDLRHDPGRTAKYLETPWAAERQTLLELIAQSVAEALR